ncbi:hypothetical protein [Streptomyces sp. JJ36]|uniref:hypothetical protein n=1 Tax=Streptomyces sp. JJ36 TaxID=2736645 RepID=UPI001F1E2CEB|nr:hypothetical protein [Streptomyces sp. JJ36]MCF6525585.1 hypothetical protein [Streptomyces sp. JJ36]
MGAAIRATFRVRFTEYRTDPNDPDCLRRAVTVRADRISFADEHLILWLAETEASRYPLSDVESVTVEGSERHQDPAAIRAQYPNAGQPWSADDEERLLTLYREGTRDLDELGAEFGRQPSAIRSRLARLGFEQL